MHRPIMLSAVVHALHPSHFTWGVKLNKLLSAYPTGCFLCTGGMIKTLKKLKKGAEKTAIFSELFELIRIENTRFYSYPPFSV